MFELPDRPEPPRSIVDRGRAWVEWVGIGRLAASAMAIVVVLAGGYWLVKPPAATTESKLPYAGSASTPVASTAAASTAPSLITPTASATTVASEFVVVHVAGAVSAPGVYQLVAGSRAIDAVTAAGGLAANANPDAVNLAAHVSDGERVYVPAIGELLAPVVTAAKGSGSAPEVWPININSADASRLEELPGVGPATSALIIAYRDQHGPFASVEQLADVRGIGPAKLDAIRALVTV